MNGAGTGPRELLVATRNGHKLREIRRILGARGLRVLSLDDAGVPASPEDEAVEAHATFRANALAKARWYGARAGRPTLADDSGLVVAALDGLPGVRSRRFAEDAGALPPGAFGDAQDEANNRLLLERLADVPPEDRSAWYACAVAVVAPGGGTLVALGTWGGRIAQAPAGSGGFGYDPLFFVPETGCTAAELPPGEKDRRSHRARALRAAAAGLGAVLE